MTISFSGLASGLDTSSWVKSLTALKQAKVTTLEEKKQVLQATQDAVAGIKQFFNSFRSVLEKVTDAKFSVGSMDIFSQKLAVSSNAKILTAIAKPEADEGKYEIKVDKLASNTRAESGFKYINTIVTTSTATTDSYLKNIGVKSGNIVVNNNGVSSTIAIGENDTIQNFIDKLQKIGVNASFNNKTGIFSTSIDANDINDVDNTGIVSGLHLKNVNHGYSSNGLFTQKVDNVYNPADGNTKLSALGVNAGTIRISANDSVYDVVLESNDTIQDFIDALNSEGIKAGIKDGVFTLEDAVITNDGATNLINAFGLTNPDVAGNSQISGVLKHETSISSTISISGTTKLSEINGGSAINGNETVVLKSDNGAYHTITVNNNTTVDDLMSKFRDAGLTTSLNKGVFSFSGGEVVGGTYDLVSTFGLTKSQTDDRIYKITGSNQLFTKGETKTANSSTTLRDLGLQGLGVLNFNGISITMKASNTLGNLIDELNANGCNASLSEGSLKIENMNSFSGNLAELLGLTSITTNVDSENNIYKPSGDLTYKTTVLATTDSTLGQLGAGTGVIGIYDSNGELNRITVAESTTLDELMQLFKNNGINSSLTDGVLKLSSSGNRWLEDVNGMVLYNLGITASGTTTTVTTGGSGTSSGPVYFESTSTSTTTVTVDSTGTKTVGNSVTSSAPLSYTKVYIGKDIVSTNNLTFTRTIRTTETTSIVTTSGIAVTSASPITYTTQRAATMDTTLKDLGIIAGDVFNIFRGDDVYNVVKVSYTISASDTSLSLDSFIKNRFNNRNYMCDFVGSMDANGVLTLTSNDGYYLTGTGADKLGLTTKNQPFGTLAVSDSAVKYTVVQTRTIHATESTLLSDLGVTNFRYVYGMTNSSGHERYRTINLTTTYATPTLGNLIESLNEKGIYCYYDNLDPDFSSYELVFDEESLFHIDGNQGLFKELGLNGGTTMAVKMTTCSTNLLNTIPVSSSRKAVSAGASTLPVVLLSKITNETTWKQLDSSLGDTFTIVYNNGTESRFRTINSSDSIVESLNWRDLNSTGFVSTAFIHNEQLYVAARGTNSNANYYFIEEVFEKLGLKASESKDRYLYCGASVALDREAQFSTTVTPSLTSKFSNFGLVSPKTLTVSSSDGSKKAYLTVNQDTTIENFISELGKYGLTLSPFVTNGYFRFNNSATASGTLGEGAYVTSTQGAKGVFSLLNINMDSAVKTAKVQTTDPILLPELATIKDMTTAGNVTMAQLGLKKTRTIKIGHTDGSAVTYKTVYTSSTLKDVLNAIGATITSTGTISIPSSSTFVQQMPSDLASVLKLFGKSFYTRKTTYSTKTITSTETVSEIGTNDSLDMYGFKGGIKVRCIAENGDLVKTYLIEDSNTIKEIQNKFDDGWFKFEYTDGKFKITATDKQIFENYRLELVSCPGYESYFDQNLAFFGFENDTSPTTVTESFTWSSTVWQSLTLADLNGKQAFSDSDDLSLSVLNLETGQTITRHFTSSTLVSMVYNPLKQFYDITYNPSTGTYTYNPKEGNNVVLSMGDKLKDLLKLNKSTPLYNVETFTTGQTVVTTQTIKSTETISRDTTFMQLGLDTSGVSIAKFHSYNGSGYAVSDISGVSTVGDFIDELNARGYTTTLVGGRLRIQNNRNDGSYIELPEFVKDIFALDNWNDYTTSTVINKTNSDSKALSYEKNVLVNGDTKLGALDGFTAGSLKFKDKDGNVISLDVTDNTTIGNVLDNLQINGITVSGYNSSTKQINNLQIIGEDGSELLYSGTSNLWDVLGLRKTTETVTKPQSNAESKILTTTSIIHASGTTRLGDLISANGYVPSDYTLTINGHNFNFNGSASINDVINEVRDYGYNMSITSDGYMNLQGAENLVVEGSMVDLLFANITSNLINGSLQTSYSGTPQTVTNVSNPTVDATNDTKLADLGVTAGEYYIYSNGVKYKAMVADSDTIGDFKNTLASFGIQAGLVNTSEGVKLMLIGNGDSYIASSNASFASNIVDKLFSGNKSSTFNYSASLGTTTTITTDVAATEDTLLGKFGITNGELSFSLDGLNHTVGINENDTIRDLIQKFNSTGIKAELKDGKLVLKSEDKAFNITKDTSNLMTKLGLTYSDNLGGYCASTSTVEQTLVDIKEGNLSAANYADNDTKLSLLNITSGTLSLYRNGEKALIQVDENETFGQLRSKITTAFADVDLTFDNGKLKIASKNSGVTVTAGSSVDTSNIFAICGLTSNEDGSVTSSRELYRVNGSSKITQSGLFRDGDVKEGTFTVGNAVFNITKDTTLNNIISQINSSEEANATAFWDSINGQFVIKSRTTGASMVNIEAGTSNFTDILGFTTSEWNPDGTLKKTKLNVDNQVLGDNAKFSINGTSFTSSSNTITSDISRIQGVTINLKDISKDETVTLSIEKDKDTVANAIEDIVKSYNELIENVDKELANTGKLHGESTLKLLRNQIRSLMTSSVATNSAFRNLDSIGIGLDKASANNISTANINVLSFDKEKFLEAYAKDPDSIKKLLVGDDDISGIFTRVEQTVESALKSVTGYFDSTKKSFDNKINTMDRKITTANKAVDRYKIRLENKFKTMDLLISNMQNQYSSFLGTGIGSGL